MSSASGADPVASRDERLEFLRQSMAFTEHNIRSYDTKAQISLAAFLLSMTPLWTIVSSLCPGFAARPEALLIVLLFIMTILLYCYVLWPMQAPDPRLTSGLLTQNLFYMKEPLLVGPADFKKKLEQLSVEDELTAENLKLAQIRTGKHRRFNIALMVTFLFYVAVAATFLLLRRAC